MVLVDVAREFRARAKAMDLEDARSILKQHYQILGAKILGKLRILIS